MEYNDHVQHFIIKSKHTVGTVTEKKGAQLKRGIQSEAYRLEQGFGRGSDIQKKRENNPLTQKKVMCKHRVPPGFFHSNLRL